MAAVMFAKRAKPGSGRAAARRPQPASDSDSSSAPGAPLAAPGAAKRRPLSLDQEEQQEAGQAFRVKKSKLSRQMSARAVAAPPKDRGAVRGGLRSSASARRLEPVSRESLEIVDSDDDAAPPPEGSAATTLLPTAAVAPGGGGELEPGGVNEEEEEADSSDCERRAQVARLARAQRAAARELGAPGAGASVEAPPAAPREDEYIPLVASKPASQPPAPQAVVTTLSGVETSKSAMALSTQLSAEPESEDAADAWALQQMRLGAHRRYGMAAPPSTPVGSTQRKPAPGTVMSGAGLGKKASADVSLADEAAAKVKTPAQAMAQLWETVARIEGGAGDRAKREAELQAQKEEATQQLKSLEEGACGLDKVLRAVQELEELAWSLGGLLDAKAPKLKQASQTLARMEQDFADRRGRRRALDLARELRGAGAALSAPMPASEVDEEEDAESRAAADRRRQRRRQRRKQRNADREGWDTSSVSEEDGLVEFAGDRAAFCTAAHKQIAADVAEGFATASAVLHPLTAVKEQLKGEYAQAYLPQSLPEVLGLYVQHSLLWWDPLDFCSDPSKGSGEKAGLAAQRWGPGKRLAGAQMEEFDWFGDLAAFTELRGEKDPDAELVPQLIQKSVFPEVARRLRECWDVTSSSQSARAAAMLDECLLFEVDPSASSFAGLLEAALGRLERGLAEQAPEVFVPRDAIPRWYASDARRRLLWRSCKIALCALLLEGRLPDEQLSQLVLGKVFTTRIAPHIRAPRLDPDEMALLERFTSALPKRWLEDGLPPALGPLRDVLGPRAPGGGEAASTAEAAARILQHLRCFDEAQVLLSLP